LEKLVKYINDNRNKYVGELKDFLKIPSISNNPDNKKDIERCADWLLKEFSKIGLQNAKLFQTEGNPIVYGDWLKAGKDKPTVLIYGHYDVQPVDPIELWTYPPFEPTIKIILFMHAERQMIKVNCSFI